MPARAIALALATGSQACSRHPQVRPENNGFGILGNGIPFRPPFEVTSLSWFAELLREQKIEWHGTRLHAPDWGYDSHSLAATVHLVGYDLLLHLIINAYWQPLDFDLPRLGGSWHRCVDTYLDSPDDICDWITAPRLPDLSYRAQPRSVVLLFANSQEPSPQSRL